MAEFHLFFVIYFFFKSLVHWLEARFYMMIGETKQSICAFDKVCNIHYSFHLFLRIFDIGQFWYVHIQIKLLIDNQFHYLLNHFYNLFMLTRIVYFLFVQCIAALSPENGLTSDLNLTIKLENCACDSVVNLGS